MNESSTEAMQTCLDRLKGGDLLAREDLVQLTEDRLLRLARHMLRDFPGVRRWEDTDDVFQNAAMRLHRSLSQVLPATPKDYLRLAALHIRRELIDLSRRYYGPQGHGANHDSVGQDTNRLAAVEPTDRSHEPTRLATWAEFHAYVDRLSDDDRALFDLIWYQGLTQVQAAEVLGVTERTVQRRWQQLRLDLYQEFRGSALF